MSNNQKEVQLSWEERVVSKKKGYTVSHVVIRDTNHDSFHAMVGIERTRSHFTYTVTQDFLRIFGETPTVNAGTRWNSYTKAVSFLSSVVRPGGRGRPLFDYSILKRNPHLQVPMGIMTRFSTRIKNRQQTPGPSSSQHDDYDIIWSANAYICNKQLKHYSAFVKNGTQIPVYSFVWVLINSKKDRIAHLEDLYENEKGDKMAKVRWFVFRGEIEGRFRTLRPEAREVFITPFEEEVTVESIDGVTAILTPTHFNECSVSLPPLLLFKTFLCHREYTKNEVRTFCLTTLVGYASQQILYTLKGKASEQLRISGGSAAGDSAGGGSAAGVTIPENQAAKGEPSRPRMIIRLQLRKPAEDKVGVAAEQKPQSRWLPNVNDNIELLSQDNGLRGCWFRCKVLRSLESRLKVQYYDVDNVKGSGKLEEWVLALRVVAPDNSGMRRAGRLTVRPWPSRYSTGPSMYEIGVAVDVAVDAWLEDGWWEGVVVGRSPATPNGSLVYFPGENKFFPDKTRDMRVSRDWINCKWVDIQPSSNIQALISDNTNIARPPLPVAAPGQANNSVPEANSEVPNSSRLGRPRDAKGKFLSTKGTSKKSCGKDNKGKRVLKK